jgi:tetratricopeptide (TPR) repeat protein
MASGNVASTETGLVRKNPLSQRLAGKLTSRFVGFAALAALAAGLLAFAALRLFRTPPPEYQLQKGREALLRGDILEAEKLADQLQASGYPDHAHLLKGQMFLHLRRPNSAILEYNAIRQENQEILADASLTYGLEFLVQGEAPQARRLLQWVLSVRPDNLKARKGMAALYYDQGVLDFAIQQVERWRALDPADGQAERFLGRIYQDRDEPDAAIDHYRAALEHTLTPSVREQTRVELAELLIGRGKFAPARELLDGESWETVERGTVATLRAECLYCLGQPQEAIGALEGDAAAEESPRRLRLQARLRVDQGDPAAAAALLERAVRLDPHDTDSSGELARVYERLGRHADAAEQARLLAESRQLWETFRTLKSKAYRRGNDPDIRRQLADLAARLGKQPQVEYWLKAASLCPAQDKVGD